MFRIRQSERIRLSPQDEAGAWASDLRRDAGEALARAESRLGVALDAPPHVRSIAPAAAFYRALGERPHNVAAVALSGENRVVINREALFGMNRRERIGLLVHEFTHLILGRRVPGAIPRWLNEGLAMVAAGEASLAYHSRVAVAATFGGLVPLDELWSGPGGPGADQELAYAESLSATRFFLKEGFRGTRAAGDDPAPLVSKLADPAAGEPLRALINDAGYMRGVEMRWRASLRTLGTWIGALTSGGVLWMGATALFLLAYWRKRRLSKAKEEAWREEEEAFPYLE